MPPKREHPASNHQALSGCRAQYLTEVSITRSASLDGSWAISSIQLGAVYKYWLTKALVPYACAIALVDET
jgi:hypothetical protein